MSDTELAAQFAKLEARLARLEGTASKSPDHPDESSTRRDLLRKGAVAAAGLAAGAVATIAAAPTAAAAAAVSGISSTDDGVYGETSLDTKAGVHGVGTAYDSFAMLAENTAGGTAIHAKSIGPSSGPALLATADWFAIQANGASPTNPVVLINGPGPGLLLDAPLAIVFNEANSGNPGTGTVFGAAGVLTRFDTPASTSDHHLSELWFCVEGNGVNKWRKLAGPTTAGTLHVLPAPTRVYDSRPGQAPAVGPKALLPAGDTRDVDCSAAVPVGASAVLVNVTVVNTTGTGYLALFSPDATYAGTSSLNWTSPGQIVANTTVCALSANRLMRVQAGGGSTDFLADIIGYYL